MAYPPDDPAADKVDATEQETDHPAHHNALANAVIDIVDELGAGPKGGSASVTARLSALDSTVAAKAVDADVVHDTGDETVAGTKTFSTTPVVPNDSWTLAKIQNIATARLLGRTTASSGDIEELAASTVRTLLNVEDGATADLSGAEILALLVAVDGAGSGLDADLLDGQSSAFYATATGLSDHLADTSDAHDATAVSFAPAGTIAATDVQAAIEEASGDLTTHAAAADPHTGYVLESLFDAHTVLAATSDNTPAAITMGASTILARLAAGNIVAATPTELRTLLNVEDGATADMSAAELLTAIKTVDGAASGLDADLLDGNSSAYFAVDADVVHDTGNETIAGVKTFSSDPIVPDEVYGAGWNGSLEPPTKNAVYDKIETISGGSTNLGYTPSPTDGTVTSDSGDDATLTLADATNAGLMAPAQHTKLAGIEALADVTDAANVAAAGAVMDTGDETIAGVKTFSSAPLVPDNSWAIADTSGLQTALDAKAPSANPTFTGTVTIPDGALAIADTSGLQAALDAKAADADVVHDTGTETIAGVKTFSSDPLIPDEAYDATGWNGVLEPPTKNAVRDVIEGLSGTYQPLHADLTDIAARWVAASASGSASLDFLEDTDNGSNKATVIAPAALAADATITLPANTGTLLHSGDFADVGTPASGDLILLRDVSDSNKVKHAAFSTFSSGSSFPEVGLPTPSGGTKSLAIPGVHGTGTNTNALVANQLLYNLWFVEEQITVDALVVEVSTAGAASVVVRLGLYAADTDWQPTGAILADAGTVAGDSTGVKTAVLGSPVVLSAGRYMAAVISDGTPTLRAIRDNRIPQYNPSLTSNTMRSGATKASQTGVAVGGLATPGTAWDVIGTGNQPNGQYCIFARLSAN